MVVPKVPQGWLPLPTKQKWHGSMLMGGGDSKMYHNILRPQTFRVIGSPGCTTIFQELESQKDNLPKILRFQAYPKLSKHVRTISKVFKTTIRFSGMYFCSKSSQDNSGFQRFGHGSTILFAVFFKRSRLKIVLYPPT